MNVLISVINRFATATAFGVILFVHIGPSAIAKSTPEFRRDEHLVVVFVGDATEVTKFGYRGRVTLFKGTSTSDTGHLIFSPATEFVEIEAHNSSVKDREQKDNYGPQGYVPPGIYYVHPLGFGANSQVTSQSRPGVTKAGSEDETVLIMGDTKCGGTILVSTAKGKIERAGVRIQRVFRGDEPNLPGYSPEGRIVLSRENFPKVFPKTLFHANSPLNSCGYKSKLKLVGNGNFLAFISDSVDLDLREDQMKVLQELLSGGQDYGLRPEEFMGSSEKLEDLRRRWRSGGVGTPPAPPEGMRVR